MELIIDCVSKRYQGKVWGLREFNLSLGPGIIGLVGPDGAGKSTLMRILATISNPTEGKVLWKGADVARNPDRLRAVLCYLPQDFGVYPNLNAIEFLEYLAAAKGLERAPARDRIDGLLELVNLRDAARRPLGGYSGGMKQRVGIAQALLNDPQVLIMDEPTVGLDPEERVRFRNLLSTHIISDSEAVAIRIAFIREGRLLSCTTPEDLFQEVEGRVWEWTVMSDRL